MTTYLPHPWEQRLLAWAEQARNTPPVGCPHPTDRERLRRAYEACAAMTHEHSRTFYMASSFLPPEKRDAARALYAFCRISDNIVDEPSAAPQEELESWRRRVQQTHPEDDSVLIAWADARERFFIPPGYADQLIDGVKRDLMQSRYATFAELTEYAYGVASTVGLMSMHIVGFAGEEAVPYAVRFGVALQLTNILRDVGQDWRIGRLYLPQDELADFGVSEADIAAGRLTSNWRRFMRFQVERTRAIYNSSWSGIRLLDRDGRFAITAAGRLYNAILNDIERHDYDVFSRRAHVGVLGKISRLPQIWLMSRCAGAHQRN